MVGFHLENLKMNRRPVNLYSPVSYVLGAGGKRVRPALVLMTGSMFNDKTENLVDLAIAFEIFHNFTLVHDDLMDNANVRRGNSTVHEKWNNSTAILSGDAMVILAYQYLQNARIENHPAVFELFNKTALEVCEGQMLDMDFERKTDITEEGYMEMIRLKTSVLLAACMKGGALGGGASPSEAGILYETGINMGLAFQLRDDYLDTYGDPAKFGKKPGGDIVENKKTLLFVKALELAKPTQRAELIGLYTTLKPNPNEKVKRVIDIFNSLGIPELINTRISDYTHRAFRLLEELDIPAREKQGLEDLMKFLLSRET